MSALARRDVDHVARFVRRPAVVLVEQPDPNACRSCGRTVAVSVRDGYTMRECRPCGIAEGMSELCVETYAPPLRRWRPRVCP